MGREGVREGIWQHCHMLGLILPPCKTSLTFASLQTNTTRIGTICPRRFIVCWTAYQKELTKYFLFTSCRLSDSPTSTIECATFGGIAASVLVVEDRIDT